MKKIILPLLVSSLFGTIAFGDICHTKHGTDYGQKGVTAYAESNHGPDGSLFLDPYFKKDIENLKDKKLLDAGCGAAPWAIYAAQHGAEVYAIDIQEGMIEAAKNAVQFAKLADKVSVIKGDVATLPYDSDFFDEIISICVGCNLPPESFEKHFIECWRTLKNDGIAVVGAPTSLDVAFSNGSKTEAETRLHIQEILDQLPDNPTADLISDSLVQLEEVLSATFYVKDNRLALVTNEKDLQEGQQIWRKLPKLVVPNRYYSKNYYVNIFKKHGFDIQNINLPHFNNEDERTAYNENASANAKLGKEYVVHAPFVIFHIKKERNMNGNQNAMAALAVKLAKAGSI